ncbi:MAG: ABC transporter permease [Blastochloris sp.]|nr:ABC transporter permease [Blastochloris sp.]
MNQQEELVIESGRSSLHYWMDLWRYRELFVVLAWRDLSVRYKQTLLGVLWAIIPPFATMLIMTVVFSKVAGLPSQDNVPYAIMVFTALLPWQFFASSIGAVGNSLLGSSHLISKVYFPRLIIPASSIIVCLCDSFISIFILFGLMVWYSFLPSPALLLFPLLLAATALTAFGPGLLLSSLNIKYRDFRFVIPFIVQFGLYASPVGFSSHVVREKFGESLFNLYCLNPMVGIIEGFRWCLLGGKPVLDLHHFLLGFTVSIVFLWLGLSYFRKTERSFADAI